MVPEPQELNAVLERLSRLEKQNRRLKWISAAALAAVSFILLTGQAAPTPRTVEAQKFVLKDAQGNVRGWMSTIGKGSELTLGNVNAQPMIRLVVSTDSSDLHLFGGPKSGLNLSVDSGNPDISMIAAEGNGEARIAFSEHGPSFTLQDAKGFSTIVGAAPAEKAPSHKSGISGASIVLLDKDKKVIWQTP
jgi:hypothetical protein